MSQHSRTLRVACLAGVMAIAAGVQPAMAGAVSPVNTGSLTSAACVALQKTINGLCPEGTCLLSVNLTQIPSKGVTGTVNCSGTPLKQVPINTTTTLTGDNFANCVGGTGASCSVTTGTGGRTGCWIPQYDANNNYIGCLVGH
jgi:hypothetical protein